MPRAERREPEETSFSRLLELAGVFPLKGFRSASFVIMMCWEGESFVRMPKYNFNKLLREILSTKGKTQIF